tara:strand:- start:1 stop:909 length:909 start_codon:yes stop_codon:yes gene_type:complete
VGPLTGTALRAQSSTTDKTFSSTAGACTIGVWHQTQAFTNQPFKVYNVLDGTDVRLQENGAGKFQIVCSGGATTLLPDIRSLNTWYFVEFVIDFIGQTAEVWMISMTDYLAGGSPTQNGTTVALTGTQQSACSFWLQGPGGGFNSTFKDLYVTDGERLGPIWINCIYPRAEGNVDEWIGIDSALANYEQINEHSPDFEGNYLVSLLSGEAARYYLDLVNSDRLIMGAQAVRLLHKSDPGVTASITPQWRNFAGTVYEDTPDYYPAAYDYEYQHRAYRYSPFTGSSFTAAGIDASQLGLERSS